VEAAEFLGADVRLLPANVPPHREQPVADAGTRAALVRAALAGQDRLTLDTRELRREGPSYTIDTLVELRDEIGADRPLVLLVGADAFAGLPTWHRWTELFAHAHIGVLTRPGHGGTLPTELRTKIASRRANSAQSLRESPAGACCRSRSPRWRFPRRRCALLAAGREPRWLVSDALFADPALLAPYRAARRAGVERSAWPRRGRRGANVTAAASSTKAASAIEAALRFRAERRRPLRLVRLAEIRFLAAARDAQLLAGHPDLLQVLEDFRRHAGGQVDEAVVALDVDAADVLAVEAGFVGDRADDVARLHAVVVADFDAERLETFVGHVRAAFAMRVALATRRQLALAVLVRAFVVAFAMMRARRPRVAARGAFVLMRLATRIVRRRAVVPIVAARRFARCGRAGLARARERRVGMLVGTLLARLAIDGFEPAARLLREPILARARSYAPSRAPRSKARSARAGAGASSSGCEPCTRRASAAAISTAGTLRSCSYCSTSWRNTPRSSLPSASAMRCLNLAMRWSLTTSTLGNCISAIGWRVARSIAMSMLLARRDEQDRLAAAAGAAGAADAVDVGFGVGRDVVIQHVADAFDVEAARGDVGGDEDVELAVLELLDEPLALRLRDVAVDRGGAETARLQLLREFLGGRFGAREDDHRLERFGFEDARERVEFLQAADVPVALADVGRGGRLGLDRDLDGLAQVGLRDALDLARHRRREQRDAARFGRFLEHGFDVVDEAHAQHFVGFVEDERFELREIERAAFEMIDDAPRRADDDVRAALEAAELRAVALAAVDRQHVETGHVRGVALERLGDLDREFARRASTSACGLVFDRSMRASTGSANAAVLPVPVCAWPSTSRPSSSGGIVAAWIGDGVS
jgi:nicotinate-nucleotide adenylyltransferase